MFDQLESIFKNVIKSIATPIMAFLMLTNNEYHNSPRDYDVDDIFPELVGCLYKNLHSPKDRTRNYLDSNPPSEKSIFFLKISCEPFIVLNTNQACAVESVARYNPEYEVHVLVVGPSVIPRDDIHYMLQYSLKVKFQYVDLMSFVNNTPVKDLVQKQLRQSRYPLTHLSDILRVLTLWKYGGVYIDLDALMLLPLRQLNPCFIGTESSKKISNSVFALDKSPKGKKYADLLMQELVNTFNGSSLTHNGPDLVGRVVNRICSSDHWFALESCEGLQVLENLYLHPLQKHQTTSEEGYLERKKKRSVATSDVVLHMTHFPNVYAKLALKYCPRVYKLMHQDFDN